MMSSAKFATLLPCLARVRATPGSSASRVVCRLAGAGIVVPETVKPGEEAAVSRCELRVSGQLADTLLELISSRFGEVSTQPGAGPSTTVIVGGLDPASERALLTLFWDTGHDVISMRSTR